jgi:hypothetical protein
VAFEEAIIPLHNVFPDSLFSRIQAEQPVEKAKLGSVRQHVEGCFKD